MNPSDSPSDPFNLARFLEAQADAYGEALGELRRGRKRGHWMWFVFPQLAGLGQSWSAAFYGISGREEASAYLAHPVLGKRLQDGCTTLLTLHGRSAQDIFGTPDDLKLRSCLTLFASVASDPGLFNAVLAKYYNNAPDPLTLRLLEQAKGRAEPL